VTTKRSATRSRYGRGGLRSDLRDLAQPCNLRARRCVLQVRDPTEQAELTAYVAARSPALLRTPYLLVGDRAEAEDLLQEALARLAVAWRRVREQESLDGYVRRTMINLRTSRWRRRRVPTVLVDVLPERGGPHPQADVAERDAMWSGLATLPPRMRAVLVLRFYEDLTEVDAARALGCSVGTVKSQTSRALAKLRATLPAIQELPC